MAGACWLHLIAGPNIIINCFCLPERRRNPDRLEHLFRRVLGQAASAQTSDFQAA